MLMTEEQARTKWCPHARVMTLVRSGDESGTYGPHNRVADAVESRFQCGEPATCIASGCMAWRGEKPRETVRNYHDAPTIKAIGGYNPHAYEGGWQYSHTDTDRAGRKFDLLHRIAADDAPEVGYCGAFGKPEV